LREAKEEFHVNYIIVNHNIAEKTKNCKKFLNNAKKYIIDDLDYTEKNEFIKNRVNYNLEYIDNNLKIFSNDIKNKIKILADNLFNATCDDLCKIFLDNTENDIKNFFNYIVEYKKNIEIKNNFDSSTNFDDMLEFI
jgi:hypothetical protein